VILGAGFTPKRVAGGVCGEGRKEGRNASARHVKCTSILYRTGDLQCRAWVQGNMSVPHGRKKESAGFILVTQKHPHHNHVRRRKKKDVLIISHSHKSAKFTNVILSFNGTPSGSQNKKADIMK